MSSWCQSVQKLLSALLADNGRKPCSQVCGNVNARMSDCKSVAIVRAIHLCLRGSRMLTSKMTVRDADRPLLATFVSQPCASQSGTPTRLPTRSHGRDGRVMMVVHFLFASIPDFCLETNRAIDKMLRQNAATTDQSIHVKKKRWSTSVFHMQLQSSEALM
jgi:hypothetical protein